MAAILKFLWVGSEESKGINWCSKKKMTSSKEAAGLGFRELEVFNLAMLAK